MAAKRALVVDDSKSARAFLSRLLEKHQLEVDAAESAEDAIEYLTRHRPDVIFMDHLMPGMDGFQAVQSIKNNPRTATIPILMYTSQEGELYVGQARALGAIGVLPKQIRPADVFKVLHQLKLVEDRRQENQPSGYIPFDIASDTETLVQTPSTVAASTPPQPQQGPVPQPAPPTGSDVLIRDQIAELRRFLVVSLDQQTDRVLEDVRQMLREDHSKPPPVEVPAPAPDTSKDYRRWAGLALAASVGALLFAGLWLNESADRRVLQRELRAATAPGSDAGVVAPPAGSDATAPQAGAVPAGAAPPVAASAAKVPASRVPAVTVLPVPYGEVPLAGARVERVRNLLVELAQSGFHGSVDVHTYPGRFCLSGNAAEGYSLAPDDLAFVQCDVLGNPADESMGSSQRQSLPFASMIAERRKASAGTIDIRVSNGSADQTARSYPEAGDDPARVPRAGEWNTAAAANNRVEVRWTRLN